MRWCARSSLRITNAAWMQKRGRQAEKLQVILAGKPGGKETLRNLDKSHGFPQGEVRTLGGQQFPERFILERMETGRRPSEILRLATRAR